MPDTERPPGDWERLTAELSAYRAAQARVWGGLADVTVARVLAGTASPAEVQLVTHTAADHPPVAQLLGLLRDVLATPGLLAADPPPGTVTVFHQKTASGGLLLRHAALDKSGQTVSVVGPRSSLSNGAVGDSLVVRLPNRGLVVGRLTHLHPTGNTYRAEVAAVDVLRVDGVIPPPVRAASPTGQLVWAGRRAVA